MLMILTRKCYKKEWRIDEETMMNVVVHDCGFQ